MWPTSNNNLIILLKVSNFKFRILESSQWCILRKKRGVIILFIQSVNFLLLWGVMEISSFDDFPSIQYPFGALLSILSLVRFDLCTSFVPFQFSSEMNLCFSRRKKDGKKKSRVSVQRAMGLETLQHKYICIKTAIAFQKQIVADQSRIWTLHCSNKTEDVPFLD